MSSSQALHYSDPHSTLLPSEFSSISIVIPAYNEERRLLPTLHAVLEFLNRQRLAFSEVIVVDDGSLDATAAIVQKLAESNSVIRLVSNPGNRGKGYAVRNGVMESRGDWVLVTDADLSAPIDEAAKLASAALAANSPIAIGSRALDRALIGVRQNAVRELCGRVFNASMRLIAKLPYRDTQCGFKLFRADIAQMVFSRQRLDGFSFDVENLFVGKLLGVVAVEVPVRWNNVEGTKVGGLSGLKSFIDLLRIRWYHLGETRERTWSGDPVCQRDC